MPDLSRWVFVVAGVASLALIAGLLVSNFMGGETKIEHRIERLYALDDPHFTNELGVLLGPPFLKENTISALLNGDQILPPMLAAIRAAKVAITFETYIYWSIDIGQEFADALAPHENTIKSSDQALSRRRLSGTGASQISSSANRWLTSRCFASSARTAMITSRKRASGSSFQ